MGGPLAGRVVLKSPPAHIFRVGGTPFRGQHSTMTQLLTAIHRPIGTRNQKATWKPVFHCTAEGQPASPTLHWTPQAQDWQEIPSPSPRGTCHAGYTVRAPPGSLAGGLRGMRREPFKTNGKISSKPLEKIKTLEGANSVTVQILSYSFRNQALYLESASIQATQTPSRADVPLRGWPHGRHDTDRCLHTGLPRASGFLSSLLSAPGQARSSATDPRPGANPID